MSNYKDFTVKDNGDWNLDFIIEGEKCINQTVKSRLQIIRETNKWAFFDGIDLNNLQNNQQAIQLLIANISKVVLDTAGVVQCNILNEKITITSNGVITIPFQFKTIESEDLISQELIF